MQVILSKEAQRHFKNLPQSEKIKIRKKLLVLQENPYDGKKLSGKLETQRSLRAWPYRIIYFFNKKEKRVEINSILHRQGVYK